RFWTEVEDTLAKAGGKTTSSASYPKKPTYWNHSECRGRNGPRRSLSPGGLSGCTRRVLLRLSATWPYLAWYRRCVYLADELAQFALLIAANSRAQYAALGSSAIHGHMQLVQASSSARSHATPRRDSSRSSRGMKSDCITVWV